MGWLWSHIFREWTWSKLVFRLKNRTLNCWQQQQLFFSDLGHHVLCLFFFLIFWISLHIIKLDLELELLMAKCPLKNVGRIIKMLEEKENVWAGLCALLSVTTFTWERAVELLLAATYLFVLECFVLQWRQSDYGCSIWQNKVARLFTVTNNALFNNPSPSKNAYI